MALKTWATFELRPGAQELEFALPIYGFAHSPDYAKLLGVEVHPWLDLEERDMEYLCAARFCLESPVSKLPDWFHVGDVMSGGWTLREAVMATPNFVVGPSAANASFFKATVICPNDLLSPSGTPKKATISFSLWPKSVAVT
jgi:hypothetical protein